MAQPRIRRSRVAPHVRTGGAPTSRERGRSDDAGAVPTFIRIALPDRDTARACDACLVVLYSRIASMVACSAAGVSSRRLRHHLEALSGSCDARRQRPQSPRVLHEQPGSWGDDGSTDVRVGWAGAAAAPPAPKVVHMSEEDTYMFDLQGCVVLRQVVSHDVIQAANQALDRLEELAPPCGTGSTESAGPAAGGLPYPCVLGDERTESNLYISNVLEGDLSAFAPFIDIPEVIGVIADTAGGSWRLNHTYSICRWGGGQTHLHGAGTPVNLKTSYRCENGQIVSSLTKAVFPLLDSHADSGCFACM